MSKPTEEKTIDDLNTRAAMVEPKGLDESTRSISCVMSTETPVRMYDWMNGGYVDEVLRADGATIPEKLPLLDSHSRYSLTDVVGSARGIEAKDGKIVGRVYFAEGVARAEDAYQLAKQGHLTDVSVGYRYGANDYVDIKKGQTATVAGREYKAKDRTLRVVTSWQAYELSVTPIGADRLAKMRSLSDCKFGHRENMEEKSNITLTDEQTNDRQASQGTKMAAEATTTTTEQTRTEAAVASPASQPAPATVNTDAVRAEAQRAERERIAYARSFKNVRSELVDQAINEGWERSAINERFLQAVTSERSEPVPVNKQVAIHTPDNQLRKEQVQALFLHRAGINLETNERLQRDCFHATFSRHRESDPQEMGWALRAARTMQSGRGNLEENAERAMEFVHRHRSISMVNLCQMALDWAGVEYNRYDEREIVTRAATTMQVAALMSNALGAMILDDFTGINDTTQFWCAEKDVPNNLPQPIAKAGMVSRLRKRRSGQVPVPVTREATEEYIVTSTFSEQCFIDRIDFLADRFGTVEGTERQIGVAAGEVRPDMAYAQLLLNPTMGDGNALFSAAHSNVEVNAPLTPDSLAKRKSALANQLSNGRLVGARPGLLLVPETISHYADELVNSSEKRNTTANTTYGTKNWVQGKFNLQSESRLDVGCVNPDNDQFVAGRPNDYYVFDAMRRWGAVVAYIRAAGRGPIMEPFTPGDGRIGFGMTVELDLGFKWAAWEGVQCGTGAGSR